MAVIHPTTAIRLTLHVTGRLVILAYALFNVAAAWLLRPMVIDVPLERWNQPEGVVAITTVIMLVFGLGLAGWCFRPLPRYDHHGRIG